MKRDIVKVREVGNCIVVGLSQPILKIFRVKKGDRVMVCATKSKLVVTKEE